MTHESGTYVFPATYGAMPGHANAPLRHARRGWVGSRRESALRCMHGGRTKERACTVACGATAAPEKKSVAEVKRTVLA